MKQEMKNVKKVIALVLVYALLGSYALPYMVVKGSSVSTTTTASDWSDWSPTVPSGLKEGDELQTRTTYRYRDKETTTSTNSSMSGWTQYDKQTTWGNYSAWQDSPVSSSSTRQVQTQTVQVSPAYTQYRYGRYYSNNCSKGYWRHFCPTCANSMYGGTWNLEYTDWMNSPVTTTGTGNVCPHYSYQNANQKTYVYNGQNWYYQEARTVPATSKTQYRYRDSKTTYYYYKWGNYSNWSTTKPSSNSNRQIEQRTEYRFKKAAVTTTEATTTESTTTQAATNMQNATPASNTTPQTQVAAKPYFSNMKVLQATSYTTKTDTASAAYTNKNGKRVKKKKNDKVNKGDILETKNGLFEVTSVKKKTACYMGVDNNKKKTIKVDSVKYDGKKYNVTEIYKGALKGNKKITRIVIGKNVKKIGKNAFRDCVNLKCINVESKKVTSIGENAFRGCKNLKELNIHSKKIKKVGKHAFKGVSRKLNIGIPKGCKNKYQKLFQKGK